jgi:lysozyme
VDLARLEQQIMRDEGFSARPYFDSVGVVTQGYGSTRILGRPVQMDDSAITATVARQLMRADLFEAILDAGDLFPRLQEMNSARQEVLVNMAYNLGRAGLAGFSRLRSAADRLDYSAMAHEMEDSRWFSQVGIRSQRLVAVMLAGEWHTWMGSE